MSTETTTPTPVRRRRRLLLRGESTVAGTGLVLGVLLVAAMAVASWWATRSHVGEMTAERARQARMTADALASATTAAMANSDLEGVRRAVGLVCVGRGAPAVRLSLGDGRPLVTSDETPTLSRLPEVLPAVSEGAPVGAVQRIVDVPGRGQLVLSVTPSAEFGRGGVWHLQLGLGAVGVAGLAVLLVVYRRLRSRVGAMGAIQEALLEAAAGEDHPESLRVDDRLGAAAQAWNSLVADREQLREKNLGERAGEALATRAGRRGSLQDACDAMWQGFVVMDEQMRVKYANGAASVFLQTARDKLVGADLAGVINNEQMTETLRGVADGTIKQRRTIEIEREGESSGVLRLSVRPVRRDDAGVALVMIEDVTQQRVAEKARHSFVAQATHELRTPLTNIRLYVEQAQELTDADVAERAKCLNVINQEARRLERVVSDMLSVSEIEAGSLKLQIGEVRLDALFPELQEDYRAQAASKDISLKFELPPKLPVLRGDRDKIAVVMHNLIGNALKYTPSGGEVKVHVEADERHLTVSVQDNGIGIGEGDAERIFDRFYRARDKRVSHITGSGLGLAIAKEIAVLHGGDITLNSVLNQGSNFTVTIPSASEGAVRLAA